MTAPPEAPPSWRLMDRLNQSLGGVADSAAPSPDDQRRSIVALAAVAVFIFGLAAATHTLTPIITVAVIAAVIMLHEAGHFTVAKLIGMKVTEFFLGFGPRLWSVRKGETEYGIKLLPLGGYVRIVGMNNIEPVDPVDEARTYRQQSFPKRFGVAVAGSTVHFVLALLAAFSLFAFAHTAKVSPVIADFPALTSGTTPAQRAGFQVGDRFVAFDGHLVAGHWTQLHTYIQSHAGKAVTFTMQRQGRLVTIVATPVDGSTVLDQGQPVTADHVGFLGFDARAANDSLLGSVPRAAKMFWTDGVLGTFKGIGAIFSPSGINNIGNQVTSAPGSTPASQAGARPSSPLGIVQIAGQLPSWPDKLFLFFEANAFVGVLNLFPILPFDGGHVLLAVYERIRSRKGRRYFADVNKMLPYSMVVVVLIGFVFLSSFYLDLTHPITLH
jgi:membrane-associated protease RseP (regulator of RpoE activity)